MSIGDFPASLSQAMLVGVMLVGRLGVRRSRIVRITRFGGDSSGIRKGGLAKGGFGLRFETVGSRVSSMP